MNYDNLKFFIIDIDDLPQEVRSDGNIKFCSSRVKYSVIGTTEEIYDQYVKDLNHTPISKDLAIKGSHWWGEVRVEKSAYKIVDGLTVKSKAPVSEETLVYVLELMKLIAKLNVEYEIEQTSYPIVTNGVEKRVSSNPVYCPELLQKIEECSTIREINIFYEEYLDCEMPRNQALELGLYDDEGKRIFSENRSKPSYL